MVNAHHTEGKYAEAELTRRGTVVPDLDLTGHAIDRASQHCLEIWLASRRQNEGLNSWLLRATRGALQSGERQGEKILFAGMKFVLQEDGVWPVLKTVMPAFKTQRSISLAIDTLSGG